MLYIRYIRLLFQGAMQYRASFWMTAFGQFFGTSLGFFAFSLLFARFGSIAGWEFGEVALCYSVMLFGFAGAEIIARGFDVFSRLIVRGDFDRLLVRPRGLILQVLGSTFEFSRIGRLAQAVIILIWSLKASGVIWTAERILTLLLMLVGGVCVYTAVFILVSTFCFFTIEGIEVANVFTDGGREITQYPLDIYNKWVRRFFTFVIPYACINYYPMLYLTGRTTGSGIWHILSPLVGVLFIYPCIKVWKLGVGKYLSTGS